MLLFLLFVIISSFAFPTIIFLITYYIHKKELDNFTQEQRNFITTCTMFDDNQEN